MNYQREWNDIAGLSRLILKASWWMVIVIILISAAGVFIGNQGNGRDLSQMMVTNILLPTAYTALILALTQFLYSLFKRWKDTVLMLGIFSILLVYIINFPLVPGIQYLLIINVLISALYFQKEKVYFASILSLVSIFSLYLFYEPFSSGIARSDIFAFIGIFIGFAFISVGIIHRGHYLIGHLEKSVRNQEELLIRNIMMDRATKIDALTGLYNHKTFHEYLDRLIEQSDEYRLSFQLAIVDIDNFKQVNDQFGHWVGDIVLKRVSEQLKTKVTADDFVSRYGGEEFAMILIEKEEIESFQLADAIRTSISQEIHPEMEDAPVTVSIGMCSYEAGLGKEAFFKAADNSLYQAKKSGKNQTVLAEAALTE